MPSPRIKEGTLESVAAQSATDAWAVGGIVRRDEYGEEILSASVLIEHWNGKSWSVSSSPTISGVLTDVAVTSRRDAWAVGWEGREPHSAAPLLLHWNGARWSRVALPAAVRDASAVAALSPRDVWVVGTSGAAYPVIGEISHWDGRQWTRVVTRQNASLADIAAISRTDVWAVGNTVEPSDWNKALMMHWDGSRWQSFVRRATGGNDYAWLSAVGAASKGDVWVGGGEHMEEMSPPAIGPLMLHWDGARWTYAKLPGTGETEFSGIAPLASDDLWAVSENSYNMDPPGNGGIGSWVWHRAGNRWGANELRGGRALKDIAVIPTRRGSLPAFWVVGEIGTAPDDYEGWFPAHTLPLIRRFGC